MGTPNDASSLEGKVVVVTGATSGSGRGVARRFVAEGANVVLLARGKERLDEEAAALGERAFPIQTDVSDPASVNAAFAQIAERFGKLDVLINNAAVYRPCPIAERATSTSSARPAPTSSVPSTRVGRRSRCSHAAGSGDIINTSSESTLDPWPFLSMYVASKAALEAFTKTLHAEMAAEDIRVTLLIQGTAADGEGSTDWSWDPDRAEQAYAHWGERGYLAKAMGRGMEAPSQSVDDIAAVHVFIATRPRGQQLDTIHVRSH